VTVINASSVSKLDISLRTARNDTGSPFERPKVLALPSHSVSVPNADISSAAIKEGYSHGLYGMAVGFEGLTPPIHRLKAEREKENRSNEHLGPQPEAFYH
jgi:hypothetical protein